MNRVILAILGVMAALVVAIGVIVIVFVASGGDDDSSTTNSEGTPEPDDDGGGDNELRLLGPDPLTFDPHIAQDSSSALYIVEIFGGLLTLDPDLQIQPDLAVEIPSAENGGKTVNGDGTVTYTFEIREDALFQDRKPVTAETVQFSIERAADPATQSLVAEFFLGDIVGVDEKLTGAAQTISGIEVLGEKSIAITVEQDLPSFLYKLTYPTAFVVDPSQVENDENWTRRPNGTGPFELEEWRLGERIVLKANDRYHLGAPLVDSVRYLLAGSGITLYERDEVDVAGVGLNDILRVQDPADPLNAEYQSGERLLIDYIGFNTNVPPFDDPDVRRAFAMAIDKEAIAQQTFEGAVPVADSIVMPGMPAYNPDAQAPEFDPEGARELLAQSRYGDDLPEITFAESGTGATSGPATLAILEMWRDNLGVEVEIEQAEVASFFQDVSDGQYQMWGVAWIMDYPLEDDLLNIHFNSESDNNDTFYSNPEVDDLLNEALLEQDSAARIALYQEAEQIILEDSPWIPLFYDQYHVLIKPYVQNYLIPASIVPRLRFVELEPH